MREYERIKTPFYSVDMRKFFDNCTDVMKAFSNAWGENVLFGYSVKTNHDSVLICYANENLNWLIETVSDSEYEYCNGLGIKKEDMIYNGPYKGEELQEAVAGGSYINLDNYDEVVRYCALSEKDTDRVGVRINFDLENECPMETTAGKSVSRFGIDCNSEEFEAVLKRLEQSGIYKIGLHMHMSTKTRSLKVFESIAKQVVVLQERYSLSLSYIDIGGGFFGGQRVQGKPSMDEYADTICSILKKRINPKETKLIIEPGASVLATCVSYITKVVNVRDIRGSRIVTLDGSALHINPFLVSRNQPYEIIEKLENTNKIKEQIVVGCTCMENDRFITAKNEEELKCGDILSFKNAGAYTMAFNSDFIICPPEVVYKRTD